MTPLYGTYSTISLCVCVSIFATLSCPLQESNKGSRRVERSRGDEDVPPPLPPPPPPALLDPPPITYHTHPTTIYPPNINAPVKTYSVTATSQTGTTSTTRLLHQANGTTSTTHPLHQANGRNRPVSSSHSRDSFNLEQFLQNQQSGKHRSPTINYNEENVINHHQQKYQRSHNNDKSRYEISSENTLSHYNNSNNNNLSVAQAKANRYSNGTGVKYSSPRKGVKDGEIGTKRHSIGPVHKTDIRMGTGGMMSVYGAKVSPLSSYTDSKSGSGSNNPGPPKPPRTLESQSSDANLLNGRRESNGVDKRSSNDSKIDALSTYISNTNLKEKIYDRVAKNRNVIISNGSANAGYVQNNNNNNTKSKKQNIPSLANSHNINSNGNSATTTTRLGSSSSSPRGPPPPPNTTSTASGSGGIGTSSCIGRAPASLPLSASLNGYNLQRSQTHSHIVTATNSLERDSRPDARNRLSHLDTNVVTAAKPR